MAKLIAKDSDRADTAPDTGDMVVIHRIFRTGFPELAALVRGVAPGDRARAAMVAPHIEFLLEGIGHHHTAEDLHIWPRLVERAPDSTRDLISRMQVDHVAVDDNVQRIRGMLPGWRTNPSAETLAGAIDDLDRTLVGHLDIEEREVLPLVEAHLTAVEWHQLGEDAFAPFTSDEKLVATGQMIDVATPEEAAKFMGQLPAPIRIMWKLFGHRKYRRYIDGVRGPA